MTIFSESELRTLYLKKGRSVKDIAKLFGCSAHKVKYWMEGYHIPTRSISEAIYLKNNPDGDPFKFVPPKNIVDAKLFGLGIGLYWGEGTKADKASVRLGNTDPKLLKDFIRFLTKFFQVEVPDFHFGLQLFNDIDPKRAMDFWSKTLRINKRQFYKTIVTKSVSQGTYKKKAQYGVLTVYYHNKKLRDLLLSLVPM